MTCDHTAGVTVRSELVFNIDDLSGLAAHSYILDVQSVICEGCGLPFMFDGLPGMALKIVPAAAHPRPLIEPGPTVTAEDFEAS